METLVNWLGDKNKPTTHLYHACVMVNQILPTPGGGRRRGLWRPKTPSDVWPLKSAKFCIWCISLRVIFYGEGYNLPLPKESTHARFTSEYLHMQQPTSFLGRTKESARTAPVPFCTQDLCTYLLHTAPASFLPVGQQPPAHFALSPHLHLGVSGSPINIHLNPQSHHQCIFPLPLPYL